MFEQVKVLLEGSRILQVKAEKNGDRTRLEFLTVDGDIVIIYGDDLYMDVVYNRVGDHRKSKGKEI